MTHENSSPIDPDDLRIAPFETFQLVVGALLLAIMVIWAVLLGIAGWFIFDMIRTATPRDVLQSIAACIFMIPVVLAVLATARGVRPQ